MWQRSVWCSLRVAAHDAASGAGGEALKWVAKVSVPAPPPGVVKTANCVPAATPPLQPTQSSTV